MYSVYGRVLKKVRKSASDSLPREYLDEDDIQAEDITRFIVLRIDRI